MTDEPSAQGVESPRAQTERKTEAYLDALALKMHAHRDREGFANAVARVLLEASEIVEEAHGIQVDDLRARAAASTELADFWGQGSEQQPVFWSSVVESSGLWFPSSRVSEDAWLVAEDDALVAQSSYAIDYPAGQRVSTVEEMEEPSSVAKRARVMVAVGLPAAILANGLTLLVAAGLRSFRPNPYLAMSLVLGGIVLLSTCYLALRDSEWVA